MFKIIGQWGLQVVILILLVACGGGGGDTANEEPDPTIQSSTDFVITHFSSLIGESRLDYSLIPASDTVINTADLKSTEVKVQLDYPDKSIQLSPSAVSIEEQTVTFRAPGNVQQGQLSLVTANAGTSKIQYRVIEENTPRLIDIQPVSVKPGDLVTVTGANLPDIPLSLVFDLQVPAVSINVTPVNNSFTFTVPSNLATGEFYLQLAQYQTNQLYLSVKRSVNADISLPDNLLPEVGEIDVVVGGEEYPVDANLSVSFPVENNSPEIVHVFADKDEMTSVLFSSVILPDASEPVIFDAKSTAIAWTMMGLLLTTDNLSESNFSDLYTQLQNNEKVQFLADHIAYLQERNSGQWLNLNDAVLIQKFRDVAEDLMQDRAIQIAARTSHKTTVSNSYITISQDPDSSTIYVNDTDYSYYPFSGQLVDGTVSIVNDTQMYLSVEARSSIDNSIINGYKHNPDVFYSNSKSLIGPKGILTIASSTELDLEGEDAHLEIVTGGWKGESDKSELNNNLRARLLVDGVFVPLTNTLLNILIDKTFPDESGRKLIYGVMNSVYGSGFLKDLALYTARPDFSFSGMISTFLTTPLSNSLSGCLSVPPREGCVVLANALVGAFTVEGPINSSNAAQQIVQAMISGVKEKILQATLTVATGIGPILEALDITETGVYAVADGLTISESLIDMSFEPEEINVDVEFALDIENVTPTCIGVDNQNNYNFVLEIEGEGFIANEGLLPSVYLGVGFAETALSSVSAFNNGTLLSAVDDPLKFANTGSEFYDLFVEYESDMYARYDGAIQFIDINDSTVFLDKIEPEQANVGSTVVLHGCGWIPLDDINVHFKSDNGEVLVSDIVSRSIDEIKVKVPDEAVSGMVYVTAGNKTTSKEFFEIKTFSLKSPESPGVLPGEELTFGGKGLDETSAVYFSDHSGNSINATLGGITDNSIIVTVPEGLIPGVITVYAERPDGKMTNEIELVISPSMVTATPEETAFENSIQVTLNQSEDFDIYYRIEEAPYEIYTGPITLNASEAQYAYFSIYAFARIEVDGINYDSAEREFRYTPCQEGQHVENGACAGGLPPAGVVSSLFDNNYFYNEGWSIGPETATLSWNNCGPAEQVPSGGNPDGFIIHSEYCGSPYISNGAWYFVAPTIFLGNKSDLFGSQLNFDLKSSYTDIDVGFIRGFVVLSNENKHIFVQTFSDYSLPDMTWTHYSIPLSTNQSTNPWRVSTSKYLSSSEVATDADIMDVLTNLTDLRILGTFGTDSTSGLDNVVLGAK